MARLRHANRLGKYLFIGVDRKSSARRQNDVIDSEQTWALGVAVSLEGEILLYRRCEDKIMMRNHL